MQKTKVTRSSGKNLETNPVRVTIALVLGSMLGGTFIAIDYAIRLYLGLGASHFAEWGLSKSIGVWCWASIVWFVCLSIFGGISWNEMHGQYRRSWLDAATVGFLIPFVLLLLLNTNFLTGQSLVQLSSYSEGTWHWKDGVLTPAGWQRAFLISAYFAMQGCVVALAIWSIAYRRKQSRE